MSGTKRASIVGVSCWISPSAGDSWCGHVHLVQRRQRLGAHDDDDLGLHDRQLLDHTGDAGEVGQRDVAQRTLYAQRSVDRQRVDLQALQGLHDRATGAAVEGDALLDLRRHRRMLQQHDVGLRMARAEHRHQGAPRAVRAGLQLARERVQLTDRTLEVLLADLVIGDRHRSRGI
jgi:hypothetical protein